MSLRKAARVLTDMVQHRLGMPVWRKDVTLQDLHNAIDALRAELERDEGVVDAVVVSDGCSGIALMDDRTKTEIPLKFGTRLRIVEVRDE
jgi:hypothetical protein